MNLNLRVEESVSFEKEVFTKNYADKDGDSPCEVVIFSLPDITQVSLFYNGISVKVKDCVPLEKINLLKLRRETSGEINASFNFKVSDNNQNKLLSNMATVTISIGAYVNQPPSQVGDLSLSIANKATKIFTVADFTTATTPSYADPEGDAAFKLKVTSLPAEGKLRLNGVDVTINQEILFSQIASSLFSYVSNQSNPSASSQEFDFGISDAGSGTFTF